MAANDIARVYAASFVEVCVEKNILSRAEEEMKFLSQLMGEDSNINRFFSSPGISREKKIEFVKKVFSGELSDYVLNFLYVLIENDRQTALIDIYNAMVGQIDEANNRLRVKIVTPSGCDSSLMQNISGKLKEKFNKEIIVKEETDGSILGGIVIRINDLVIDGSLSKDLKNIRKNLLNSKVRSEVAYED